MGFSIYPFGDGENGRVARSVLVFCFFFPFGPLSVISSRSRLEMMIYPKKVPEADSYICLNYVLAICCSFYGLISVRFGGLFILFSISSGQVQGFCFFLLPFPFYLSQYTLLLATAAAYLSLSSSSLLILFPSPLLPHCLLRVNYPLLYLLIPINNHPLYCGGHSSSSPLSPYTTSEKCIGGSFFLSPFLV